MEITGKKQKLRKNAFILFFHFTDSGLLLCVLFISDRNGGHQFLCKMGLHEFE